ncbi:alpha/beta fold hydrolase [Pseudonocardia sp. C8]|uniref:PHA/PHB synthase family protein n=1 Tax=Pseudonocardia sp. C8 TaxID=2762759 RepID=UPI0016425ABF|nr:alpha/beta fold hydrolase [Pseudonocardia sp. C8]MBC3194924.1 alpha/beta fold hydrolase [Pseudonocardia sp. C8]
MAARQPAGPGRDEQGGADPQDAAPVGGEVVGMPSLGEAVGGLAAALGQGGVVAREAAVLGGELVRVALGRSSVALAKGDRRFTDPAWSQNPVYDRIGRGYLAAARAVDNVTDALAERGTEPRRVEQARFATGILTSALAPTNYLPTNPAALKRAFDTGGLSLLRGLRNAVDDLRHNGGMPSMVERDAFEVGRDLAVTPGAVVDREPVGELIQYRPSTDRVRARPILIVPPPIGRYYFLDLRPGRSLVEYTLAQEMQTFLLSWRNPTPEQGDWDLDSYAARVSSAIDTVREITGSDDVNLVGFCAGGIIATTVLNHLAATGDRRVHSMSYAVTLLDFGERAPIAAFQNAGLLRLVGERSRRTGIITSRQMGAAFTWMRPDDLVFNYVVNNYLMGDKPPAFDVLAWNADGTNLPGALHCQFLDIFRDNLLVAPGGITVLGSPVHLKDITVPTFVTGAVTDHLTPWKGCYRTTQLLGGESTFVLSYSGHIASLVNPPGNPKAHYWTGDPPGRDPDAWHDGATRHQGSWWEAWTAWLEPHAGERVAAPTELGSATHRVLDPAPGRYVRDLT